MSTTKKIELVDVFGHKVDLQLVQTAERMFDEVAAKAVIIVYFHNRKTPDLRAEKSFGNTASSRKLVMNETEALVDRLNG